MTSVKKVLLAATVLAVAGLPAQASNNANRNSTTFHIRGMVPVLCRVQLDVSVGVADPDGVVDFGTATEFCNSARGYQVYVQHPHDLEGAAIITNGERIPLSPDGLTLMTDSSRPNMRTLHMALDLGDDPSKFGNLGVRIQPK